jgi:hypothetical protein
MKASVERHKSAQIGDLEPLQRAAVVAIRLHTNA